MRKRDGYDSVLTEDVTQGRLMQQLSKIKGGKRTYWTTQDGEIIDEYVWEEGILTENIEDALLVGSICYDGKHRLALDIDLPTQLAKDRHEQRVLQIDAVMHHKHLANISTVLDKLNLDSTTGLTNFSGIYLAGDTILVHSRTSGHYHLYNDTPLTWVQYKELLAVLNDAKIIEESWYDMSLRHGMTRLRIEPYRKHVLGTIVEPDLSSIEGSLSH